MESSLPFVRKADEGCLLDVYIQPRAGRNEISGVHGDGLKIRLTAPPVEGEANKECVRFLARLLDIPKSDVELVQGHKSRRKTILIRNITPKALEDFLRARGIVG